MFLDGILISSYPQKFQFSKNINVDEQPVVFLTCEGERLSLTVRDLLV